MMKIKNVIFGLLLAGGLIGTSAGSILAAGGSGIASTPMLSTTASTWKAEPQECELLTIINAYRTKSGLAPLTISLTLSAAAEDHSADMATNNYFSHTMSDGSSWAENIAAHGYPSNTSRAENIAAGRETAVAVFEQWKNSAGHNANMLGSKFKAIGIGRNQRTGSTYTWYWTNTFGSIVDQSYTCSGQSSASTAKSPLAIHGGGRSSSSTSSLLGFDGDVNTSWHTTKSSIPRTAYVYFDLGSSQYISKIMWYFNQSGAADSFQIQISPDKRNWTTLTTRTTANTGSWQTIKLNLETRYVRFYFTNPNRDRVLGYLAEVKIYP